jgi:UDP-GlcNAc:undecaprenyl-phosphate GlcNAc-1-phosphate transferase
MQSLVLLGLCSFVLALILTPLVRNFFCRVGCLDRPDHGRKVHSRPVPRVGGISILLAYGGSFALLLVSTAADGTLIEQALPSAWRYAPAVLAIFATGLIDDLIGLRPPQKFAGQFVGAGLICWAGLSITAVAGHPVAPWLGVPLTLLWLIACTNAFNLIDGVDGLAAGVGLFATVTTLAGALLQGHAGLALATVPLAGALLAFLCFNFNPASIFLGDCGSLTIGFLLGCFGIIWSQKCTTLFGMTAPLIALSIPLLDTALAIVRRFLRRQPLFAPDRGHIHHKLLDRGLTPRRVALVLYGICGIAAALALIQSFTRGHSAGAVIVLFCLAAWAFVQHLGYVEFGIAGRLIQPGTLLRAVNAQVRLHALEDALSRAVTIDHCWDAICAACRDLGFARADMLLNCTVRDTGPSGPEPSPVGWTLRVPISETDYVNISGAFGSAVEPSIVTPLACILHRCLQRKLAALDGVAPDPEAPRVYARPRLAQAARARRLEPSSTSAVTVPLCQ